MTASTRATDGPYGDVKASGKVSHFTMEANSTEQREQGVPQAPLPLLPWSHILLSNFHDLPSSFIYFTAITAIGSVNKFYSCSYYRQSHCKHTIRAGIPATLPYAVIWTNTTEEPATQSTSSHTLRYSRYRCLYLRRVHRMRRHWGGCVLLSQMLSGMSAFDGIKQVLRKVVFHLLR